MLLKIGLCSIEGKDGAGDANAPSRHERTIARLAKGDILFVLFYTTLSDPSAVDAFLRWIIIAPGPSIAFHTVLFLTSSASSFIL